MKLRDLLPNKMNVIGFVRPSGTGKSYRAQMVAAEQGTDYIIDDGILVKGNEIIAGHSAKKAPTKIETVKKALFYDEKDKEEIQKALKKYKPESILILGTSDGMIEKIAKNLDLPPVSKFVRITDVATSKEIEEARNMRITQGKHVIPVPTFQIKKEFSGYLLDPLQIFKSKGKGKNPYIAEKSIIRPTFSYMGNFTISDNVIKEIINIVAKDIPQISKINRIRIDTFETGLEIYIEITVVYGSNFKEVVEKLRQKAIKEIDKLTTMNVNVMDIKIVNLSVPDQVLENSNNVKIQREEEQKQSEKEQSKSMETKDEKDVFKVVDINNYEKYQVNQIDKLKFKIERKLNK